MSLRHSNVIDALAHDPATDDVVMTMVEPRPWDESDARVFELQEKMNSYLSFVLDGELNEQLPQLAGKRVRLQLDCLQPPNQKVAHFIEIIQRQVALLGLEFAVRVVSDLPPDEEETCCGEHDGQCCGEHGGPCCGEGDGGACCCSEEAP